MNNFPSEILTTIFGHLHYSQKLQCKLVCRKWAFVLRSGSDIASVAIPFGWDNSTKSHVSLPLIEKVQDGIFNGENCRRLILYDYPDRALLAKLFPNLKLVCFQKDGWFEESPELAPELTSTQIGYLQNWYKSLETIIDSGYDVKALDILDSGPFQKLSTIILTEASDFPIEMITLADKLKNAPYLKKLYLKEFEVDTANLEKLHANVPYLESLILNQCYVQTRGEQSEAVQPAKSVKELALLKCEYPSGFSLALSRYITCTYPSLERFSLITDYSHYGILEEIDENEGEEERPIHYTIRKLMHNLRVLKSDVICTSSKSIMELANNAPFLEVLSADVGAEEDLLEPILESDTLINSLHSLSLYHMLPLHFELFNRFSHLKQLSLKFDSIGAFDPSYDFDTTINYLPESIDALELSGLTLDLTPTHVNDNNFSHIRSLTIESCTIKSDLSGYLSRRFPKLKSLVISCCDTKFHFELPNHHLSFVEIHLSENTFDNIPDIDEEMKDVVKRVPKYFKLTTTGDASTFYEPETTARFSIERYMDGDFFDRYDSLQYNICKPSTKYREEEELHYFHFRCASVQTLLLNKQLIL